MTAELSDASAPLYIDNSLNNTAGATTSGVYTLTYRASSAGQTMSVSFVQTTAGGGNVTLQAATLAAIPAPDFTLSATPLSQAVPAGAVARYTATVAAKNGFSGTVGFNVSGLPAGVTAGFSPATVAGNGSSTLSLTTTRVPRRDLSADDHRNQRQFVPLRRHHPDRDGLGDGNVERFAGNARQHRTTHNGRNARLGSLGSRDGHRFRP